MMEEGIAVRRKREKVTNEGRSGAANLAGISGHLSPVRNFDLDDYESVFDVNVKGTFNSLSAELRYMRQAKGDVGGGSIVNAASITGLVGKSVNHPSLSAVFKRRPS